MGERPLGQETDNLIKGGNFKSIFHSIASINKNHNAIRNAIIRKQYIKRLELWRVSNVHFLVARLRLLDRDRTFRSVQLLKDVARFCPLCVLEQDLSDY